MITKPDTWVVLKITMNEETNYKVFATWFGGYLDGDSWKMNSGITGVESEKYTYKVPSFDGKERGEKEYSGEVLKFKGYSGSVYECVNDESCYRTNSFTQGVLNGIIEKGKTVGAVVEIMPFETDWNELFNES